jgi:immune inhibitor A
LHAEYSTNGGANWTEIGTPLTGSSGGRWKTLRYSVPGGAPVQVRFRFQSDGGPHLANAFLDDTVVKSGGTTLFADDLESGDNGWTAVGGFKRSTGTETRSATATTSSDVIAPRSCVYVKFTVTPGRRRH